jgi:hypothetical protein
MQVCVSHGRRSVTQNLIERSVMTDSNMEQDNVEQGIERTTANLSRTISYKVME